MKKLEGNGLWESSRMMLFEHRDLLVSRKTEKKKKGRPLLDEQQRERIAEEIMRAFAVNDTVSLVVYGETEDRTVTGCITKVDVSRGSIQIGGAWIRVADIRDLR